MPECGDAKLLEVLRRQVRQDPLADFVLTKRGLILPKAKAPQPQHNVHDGAHNQWWRASSPGAEKVSRTDWIMGVSEVHEDRCAHIANSSIISDFYRHGLSFIRDRRAAAHATAFR